MNWKSIFAPSAPVPSSARRSSTSRASARPSARNGAGGVGYLECDLVLPGGGEDDDGVGQFKPAAIAQIPDGIERAGAGHLGLQVERLADGDLALRQKVADERRDADPQRRGGLVLAALVAQQGDVYKRQLPMRSMRR